MIKVDHISKTFALYDRPADRLKEVILRRSYHALHHALTDVSFSVDQGEVLGIAGRNGAGKSTLLKIVMGLLVPDGGSVTRHGKVTGLLELGTGFNRDLTGLQNIRFNGLLVGMTANELDARQEQIVQFAELGEFIHHPIKVYSTGMLMRLAFSIAIHAQPTCMVIDEALAVGDAYFQQKCMREIFRFRDDGGSIILVTHDMNAIRVLASRALLLDQGRVVLYGEPRDVADRYQALLVKEVHSGAGEVLIGAPNAAIDSEVTPVHVGAPLVTTGDVTLADARLLDAQGQPCGQVVSETLVHAECDLVAHRDLEEAHFGIAIRNQYGQAVFETNSYCMREPATFVREGGRVRVRFSFECNLSHGDYSITFGVSNKGVGLAEFEEYHLLAHDVLAFTVLTATDAIIYAGAFNIHPDLAVEVCPTEKGALTLTTYETA
jgi:ABC-type polysaccharide/polyol phosphate transport system ATPase subunit